MGTFLCHIYKVSWTLFSNQKKVVRAKVGATYMYNAHTNNILYDEIKLDYIYKINVSKFILAFMKHELPPPIMTLYTPAQIPKIIILDKIWNSKLNPKSDEPCKHHKVTKYTIQGPPIQHGPNILNSLNNQLYINKNTQYSSWGIQSFYTKGYVPRKRSHDLVIMSNIIEELTLFSTPPCIFELECYISFVLVICTYLFFNIILYCSSENKYWLTTFQLWHHNFYLGFVLANIGRLRCGSAKLTECLIVGLLKFEKSYRRILVPGIWIIHKYARVWVGDVDLWQLKYSNINKWHCKLANLTKMGYLFQADKNTFYI